MRRPACPTFSQSTRLLRRTASAAALCGLLGMQAAHAGIFEDSELRRAFTDNRERVTSQIQALEDRLKDITGRLDRMEAVGRGQLVLNQELDAQRREIASLRNELEKALNDLAMTQRRIKDMYGDVDQRMRRMEPRQIEIDGRLAAVTPEETAAFDQAMESYKNGDAAQAGTQFEQFATRYPNSAYLPLVLFNLSDLQFARKDFRAAASTTTRLMDRYPNSPRAPETLLRLADSHASQKDLKAARRAYEQLAERYPDTPAAESARKRLALLKGS